MIYVYMSFLHLKTYIHTVYWGAFRWWNILYSCETVQRLAPLPPGKKALSLIPVGEFACFPCACVGYLLYILYIWKYLHWTCITCLYGNRHIRQYMKLFLFLVGFIYVYVSCGFPCELPLFMVAILTWNSFQIQVLLHFAWQSLSNEALQSRTEPQFVPCANMSAQYFFLICKRRM